MNCEQSKLLLAEIIENRTIERVTKAQKNTKNPTRFAMLVQPDGGLICKWSRNLTPKEREQAEDFIVVKPAGFSSEEWDDLARRFYKIVARIK